VVGVARGKYRGASTDDYDLIDVTGSGPGVVFADAPVEDGGAGAVDDVDDLDEPALDEDGRPDKADDAGDVGGTTVAEPYNPTAAMRSFLYRVVAPPDQKPPRPARTARSVPASKRKPAAELINGLDRRERIISLVAASLAFAFAVAVLIVYPHPPAHRVSGEVYIEPWAVALIVGVPAIGMGVGVAIARRALVGFLAILTGFATLTVLGVYGLLYFGLGIWLIMRASRYSKQVRLAAGETSTTRRPRAERAERSSRGGSSARSAGKSSSRPAAKSAAGVVAPAKSKRYTPPRNATAGRRRTPTS
jgi:hypothetical protein